jgi:FtsP/CotA-like multicopper oxidase with cupredoxin domain
MKPNLKTYELTASEFDWEIAEGKTIKAWGFNNTLPGPCIRAKKGDTVVVKVKNNLQQPTLIHWHGIRLQASMDGTGEVQAPIQPGDEFEYRFEVPDAGTFWYHSHENEVEQMERGMYGSLIVEDDTDPVMDGERVFMVDDMKLTAAHEFKRGNALQRWLERHDGREGETLLINGKENSVLNIHAGQLERWRFINSSSARYFRLYLGGKPFRIMATDGGLLEEVHEAKEVLIVPGERIDIVAGPFSNGEKFAIESLPYDRKVSVRSKRVKFATINVVEDKPSVAFVPASLRTIKPLALADAVATREVKLSVVPSLKRGIDFVVNDAKHATDKPVNVGELQVWEVSNTSLMDHPFHLHGFFFQVLEINGKSPSYLAWKDTVNLTPRTKIKIAWIPDNRPGKWMYHCHILEHHQAGMMAHFEVVDPARGPMKSTSSAHSCKKQHHAVLS